MTDAQEYLGVGDEGLLQQGAMEILQRTRDRRARPVDPWTEPRIACEEMAELVREYGTQLRYAQSLQQRQPQPHHAPRAKAQDAAAVGDPRVHVRHQIHFG